jgi:peptidoglycan/xylan/chitin deacetylase (PgdA/CDA1 family)
MAAAGAGAEDRLRIALQVPEEFQARARHAWEEIALRWSIPVLFTSDAASADLSYGGTPASEGGPPAVPFDPRIYAPPSRCAPTRDPEGRFLWQMAEEGIGQDHVGAIHRLLALLDEAHLADSARDRRGIFPNAALPEERRSVEAEPLVENLAASLLEAVKRLLPRPLPEPLPRWPQGRLFALSLTHDADSVHLGAPLELAHNAAKALRRGSRPAMEMVGAGLRSFGIMAHNPFFAFPAWRRWEQARGIRSAFYVYYRPPGVRWDRDDCRSGLQGWGTDWSLLRAMAEEGWEFGPHPSIHVQESPSTLGIARQWLQGKLGREVEGLRHHFWALDWRHPYRTHRAHAAAGFRYDSSIAWRDRAGFRAGTSLPYRPFDLERNETVPLLVIPCGLMDRQALYESLGGPQLEESAAVARAGEFAGKAMATGGLLTLNWHQETAWGRGIYRGYPAVLEKFLDPLLATGDVWVATPGEIARHWEGLRRSILAPD